MVVNYIFRCPLCSGPKPLALRIPHCVNNEKLKPKQPINLREHTMNVENSMVPVTYWSVCITNTFGCLFRQIGFQLRAIAYGVQRWCTSCTRNNTLDVIHTMYRYYRFDSYVCSTLCVPYTMDGIHRNTVLCVLTRKLINNFLNYSNYLKGRDITLWSSWSFCTIFLRRPSTWFGHSDAGS